MNRSTTTVPQDGTREYYEAMGEEYVARTRDADVRHLWDLASPFVSPGARILDLGCGSGRDLKHFRRSGADPVGLDFSSFLARSARIYSGCPVVQANALNLPFADRSLDAVWAIASLLHFTPSQLKLALREIRRVIRDEGGLIATVQRGTGHQLSKDGRVFHLHDQSTWRRALSAAGFSPQFTSTDRNEGLTRPNRVEWIVSVSTVATQSMEAHR